MVPMLEYPVPKNNVRLGNIHYQILEKIGSGSCGCIFLCCDVKTGKRMAIKLENPAEYNMLQHEYETLSAMRGTPGYPGVRWYGRWERYNALIMDFLGPPLDSLFRNCSRQFSLKTVLMLADQMITLLERLHDHNYIHRDIKPSNFLMGNEPNTNIVYLIDFGIAKSIRDEKTGQHIVYREDRALSGTPRYVSVNGHSGIEQSRRDDLESLGHMLIQFLNGKLPWQNLKAKTSSDEDEKTREIKMSISPERLTKDCPEEFLKYMKYCRSLRFEETPDYDYLRKLFSDLLETMITSETDLVFDWTLKKPKIV